MSTTNTTSNWLRFGAFSITVVSASSIPLATGPWPLFSSPWPLFSRPAPCAAGRKLGSFFRPILPLFVLSINVPTTNTRANWLRFGAFLSPPVPSLRIHWPLTTVYWPLFTCHWPQFSRHAPLATRHYLPRPSPAGYYQPPTAELSKSERGPISTSGPSISLCAEPGDSCAQINPVLPTRRRSPVDRSLVAGGAPRQRLEACLPDAHGPQRLFFRCSP